MKWEIDFMKEVKNIPEFLMLYDYAIKEDELKYYLMMEYVQGPKLEDIDTKKFKKATSPEE